ncbi:MAG: response regulator [Desulfobulbaceae bacterium]|nr:response regulator [Desulfobulbaceae bacterium]
MVESVTGVRRPISMPTDQLLLAGEKVYIVDDDPAIREPLRIFLEDQGLAVAEAASGEEYFRLLERGDAALALLDIGLPDLDGRSVLAQTVARKQDVAVVMLTGVVDLKVAMDCIREGADDYLSKPVQFHEILFVVKKALEKRRLVLQNRKYHEDLEKAHFRIHVLHQLSVRMNTAYLSTVELEEIMQAVLVGITAEEGLRFNRAFMAMFDDDNQNLVGLMAIGPDCREEAGRIWSDIHEKSLTFLEIVQDFRAGCRGLDREVNQIIKSLRIPVADQDNILIKSARERRSILVARENGSVPQPLERRANALLDDEALWFSPVERRDDDQSEPLPVPHDLIALLRQDSFVVVPLYSPSHSFGVIIADNFVTGQMIVRADIDALELFASQASLAIEHSHLYQDQQRRIVELEALTDELNRNKDLLIEAERFAALGQMAAQLVHSIRNPITSIGGIAKILARKPASEEQKKFLDVVGKESARLEQILDDLYSYTDQFDLLDLEAVELCTILQRTLLLVQAEMSRQSVIWRVSGCDQEIWMNADPRHLRQMFLHLFKNAVEAMSEGGILEVELSRDEQGLQVAVRDNGIGMPEDYLDKVTDPFFTTKTYGTGMGLTLIEKILKSHGGHFSIGKRAGGGVEIIIYLPETLLLNAPVKVGN